MSKRNIPAAVEMARAKIKSQGASQNNQPIVFAEVNAADLDESPEQIRRGRARKQPPAHLREQMPEHSDEAYFAAQAQLRAGDSGVTNQNVTASDYHRGGPRLQPDELQRIIDFYSQSCGPILSLDQAADITKLSKQTLRRKVCEGKFAASVFRGRPLRFITQRLLEEVLG